MRNASGHYYWNSSFIMDVAMWQISRSTERISSFVRDCAVPKTYWLSVYLL